MSVMSIFAFGCVAVVTAASPSGNLVVAATGLIRDGDGENAVRRHVAEEGQGDNRAQNDHAVRRQNLKFFPSAQKNVASAVMQMNASQGTGTVQHADFLFNYPLPLPSMCVPVAGHFPRSAKYRVAMQPQNKNVAVLIRGESFRNGGRGHREYCDDKTDSAEWQYAATQNHLHMLVQPLEEKGHKVDIFFATYACPAKRNTWNTDLVKWYGDRLRGHSSVPRGPNQTQSTTVRELFKIFHKHAAGHDMSYDGGVVVLRFDFYFLKPFTQFSAYSDFGDKLMMNEWGGGDVFFTLPWYFMNCFAGTLEQNCWDNQFFSGTPCYYGLKANLINPQAQLKDPFLNADAGCTPDCPRAPIKPSWVIHPWSIWKHQRDVDLRKCEDACASLVATTPESAPKVCQVSDGCSKLCGNAGCSMQGPVFGPR